MSKTTFSAEYIKQAMRLLPQHSELVTIAEKLADDNERVGKGRDFTPDQIDEATFRASEYLGGMCNALTAMIEANAYRTGEGEA